MSSFHISRSWSSRKGASELDATMGKLAIEVGGTNVTEYVGDNGLPIRNLEIPLYFLAEWFAENWWPLLWEPRKSEETPDDAEFLTRHSILTAQHGFALPNLRLVPTGKGIYVSAVARAVPLADIRFRKTAAASPLRDEAEHEIRKFIEATISKLDQMKIADTSLHQAWQLVTDIREDEIQFCQFAGALGLGPHEVNEHLANLLERLLPVLGERLLLDLCLVSTPANFETISTGAETAITGIKSASVATLEPLLKVSAPADNFSVEAWRRGVRAAKLLRTNFGIKDTDPSGAARVFERLAIDTGRSGSSNIMEATLTGAVQRENLSARIALLQAMSVQRRFSAARAIFAAWTAEANESRFLTSAVTRDQQASRAFAAELTAPFAFLRAKAKHSKLKQDQVIDLSAELDIGSDVVSKQALNNGLQVIPMI